VEVKSGHGLSVMGQQLTAMTVSAGIATGPEDGSTMEELLRAADEALYAAKQAGRNRVISYREREAVTRS
jgi:diguanylate cyclase (GGDEF)-like protein